MLTPDCSASARMAGSFSPGESSPEAMPTTIWSRICLYIGTCEEKSSLSSKSVHLLLY